MYSPQDSTRKYLLIFSDVTMHEWYASSNLRPADQSKLIIFRSNAYIRTNLAKKEKDMQNDNY